MKAGWRTTDRVRRVDAAWTAAAVGIAAYTLLPVLWLVSLSLKPAANLSDGLLVPRAVSVANYVSALTDPQFPAAVLNSLGVGALSTLLAVTLGALAAYAVVRLEFPAGRWVLAAALAVAMFPPVAVIGPIFDLWRALGLFDTWIGLVIPYMTFTLPLSIWVLAAYFREIPWDLEEAARVDGATGLQLLWHVLVPLAAPGVASAAILVFIFAWNDFLFAAALTSTAASRTAPVAIAFFTGSSRFELPIGSIAAASVIVTVPVVVLVLAFQRRIVAGLTAGSVKG